MPKSGRQSCISTAAAILSGLHSGRRYTAHRLADELGCNLRTAYHWLADIDKVIGLAKLPDGDGRTTYFIRRT